MITIVRGCVKVPNRKRNCVPWCRTYFAYCVQLSFHVLQRKVPCEYSPRVASNFSSTYSKNLILNSAKFNYVLGIIYIEANFCSYKRTE